jgi:hypothetical protein
MLPCAPAADFAAAPAIVCTCLFLYSSVKKSPKNRQKIAKTRKKKLSLFFCPIFTFFLGTGQNKS